MVKYKITIRNNPEKVHDFDPDFEGESIYPAVLATSSDKIKLINHIKGAILFCIANYTFIADEIGFEIRDLTK